MARGQGGFTVEVKRSRRVPGQAAKSTPGWMAKAGLDYGTALVERHPYASDVTARDARVLAEKVFAAPTSAGPRVLPVLEPTIVKQTVEIETPTPMPPPGVEPAIIKGDDSKKRGRSRRDDATAPPTLEAAAPSAIASPVAKPRLSRRKHLREHDELPIGQRWMRLLPRVLRQDWAPVRKIRSRRRRRSTSSE